MLDNIEVLFHSSIRISKNKKIYIDPFKVETNYNDADIILITHSHYDHYSEEDILKVRKEDTIIVVTNDLKEIVSSYFSEDKVVVVEPNNDYDICGILFHTVPSYNNEKIYHPKSNNWVGYVFEIENTKYYVTGDSDLTEDAKSVKCEVLFVPIGGTFTMNYEEAAELANIVKPKIAVPIHYGSIAGTKEDANKFVELLDKEIEYKIYL